MKIKLKRQFFIDGHLFPAHEVVEVPDRFADRLPSDAEVIGAKPAPIAETDTLTPQQKAARTRAENKAKQEAEAAAKADQESSTPAQTEGES